MTIPVALSPSNLRSTSIQPFGWGCVALSDLSPPGHGATRTFAKNGAAGLMHVDNEKFYFRLGLKYRFTRNWFALINMKTHGWAADCATLGLGYSIQL